MLINGNFWASSAALLKALLSSDPLPPGAAIPTMHKYINKGRITFNMITQTDTMTLNGIKSMQC